MGMNLNKFSHGVRTNMESGVINNQDACLILLHEMTKGGGGGIVTSAALKDGLRAWRPGLQFTYLFNTSSSGGYGFVGHSFNHAANRVIDYKSSYLRKTYWYRVKTGQYALTSEGIQRLQELGVTV